MKNHVQPKRAFTADTDTRGLSFPPIKDFTNLKVTNKEMTKPVKHVLETQKFSYLTSDPENNKGHRLIRKKFGL